MRYTLCTKVLKGLAISTTLFGGYYTAVFRIPKK